MTIPNTPVPDELAEVRARIKALEEREAELRKLLIKNPELREGAAWLAEVREVTSNRVDMNALRDMYKAQVDEHTYPTTSQRIVLSMITSDGEIVSARKMKEPAA